MTAMNELYKQPSYLCYITNIFYLLTQYSTDFPAKISTHTFLIENSSRKFLHSSIVIHHQHHACMDYERILFWILFIDLWLYKIWMFYVFYFNSSTKIGANFTFSESNRISSNFFWLHLTSLYESEIFLFPLSVLRNLIPENSFKKSNEIHWFMNFIGPVCDTF